MIKILNSKIYETIQAINDTKNISAAAEKLYISQPALSRYLKSLETQLNFQIFDREKTPLEVTSKGKIFISYLEKMKLLENEMLEAINKIDSEDETYLALSSLNFIGMTLLPKVVPKFIALYPEVSLKLKGYEIRNYEDLIIKENIDAFITNSPVNNSEITFEIFSDDPFLLVTNRMDFLKSKYNLNCNSPENPEFLNPADLKYLMFYLLGSEQNLRKISDSVFKKYKVSKINYKEVPNLVSAASLLNSGRGATFMAKSSLKYLKINVPLYYFKIKGFENKTSIGVAYKKGHKEKIIKNFIEVCKDSL